MSYFYSIHSEADVDYLIKERIKYAQSQKAENEDLTKDPHININTSLQSDVNPVNYGPESLGTDLTQNSDSKDSIEVVDDGEEPIGLIKGINVCDMVELQDLPCRIVEVGMQDFPTTIVDELELWESIEIPPISLAEGQVLEECIEEEIFVRSLPELCKAQESIHKDGIQLETPKVNTTEISELPREIVRKTHRTKQVKITH